MSIKIKISEAAEYIALYIKAGLVPLITGSPGIGKSEIVHALAKAYGLKLIDFRVAQADPVDLLGFPRIDPVTGKGSYAPMETFPIESDAIPKGYNGWLLFLDELTSGTKALQSAAYKLILDRQVGQFNLHKNVAIVAAGNLETDNAIVEEMSTALQSRLVHLEVVVDAKGWGEWASANGYDHRITSYINFRPDNLFTFKPDHTDRTYGCPRTWGFSNRLLKLVEVTDKKALGLLAGTLSEGLAREFLIFCKIFDKLPKVSNIVANPQLVAVPDEPSILWALCGALSKEITLKNIEPVMEFITRIPKEFQVVCLRQTLAPKTKAEKQEYAKSPALVSWIVENGAVLF